MCGLDVFLQLTHFLSQCPTESASAATESPLLSVPAGVAPLPEHRLVARKQPEPTCCPRPCDSDEHRSSRGLSCMSSHLPRTRLVLQPGWNLRRRLRFRPALLCSLPEQVRDSSALACSEWCRPIRGLKSTAIQVRVPFGRRLRRKPLTALQASRRPVALETPTTPPYSQRCVPFVRPQPHRPGAPPVLPVRRTQVQQPHEIGFGGLFRGVPTRQLHALS